MKRAGVILVLFAMLLLWLSPAGAQGGEEIVMPTVATPMAAPVLATPTVMETWPRLVCDDCIRLPLVKR